MENVSGKKLDVLIVDPDESFSQMLSSHLGQKGIEAQRVGNPTEALESIQNGDFSFVISELELPEYSGWVFSSHVRDLKNIKIPEILLICDEKLVNIEMAHKVGACHMLPKPLKLDVLVDTLHHYGPRDENQRRFERVEVDTNVYGPMNGQLKTTLGEVQSFEISNIGRGGLFMELSSEVLKGGTISKGQTIEFIANLSMVPNFQIEGTGIVRWTKEGIYTIGAGVEFLKINAEAESLIDAYVKLFHVKSYVPGKSNY